MKYWPALQRFSTLVARRHRLVMLRAKADVHGEDFDMYADACDRVDDELRRVGFILYRLSGNFPHVAP